MPSLLLHEKEVNDLPANSPAEEAGVVNANLNISINLEDKEKVKY